MLRDLKTLTLPISTKIAVAALLLLSVGVNLGFLVWGLLQDESSLLAAAIETLAALLPVILVVIVLGRADSGVSALKRRTEGLFLKILPPVLAGVVDEAIPFYAITGKTRAPAAPRRGRVYVNLKRGECFADLLVVAPWISATGAAREWKIIPVRLEINVGRINFGLLIPDGTAALPPQAVVEAFAHTTEGAGRAGPTEPGRAPSTGYVFLDHPLRRDLAGTPCTVLVANKFVSGDFLWDSAGQLYFAQDLMFMLRAFLSERPDLFPSVFGETPPSAAKAALALSGPASHMPEIAPESFVRA